MNYNQTQGLFEAMDNLETYAKMYQREMTKYEGTDWDAVNRYADLIKVSRKRIFDAVAGSTDVWPYLNIYGGARCHGHRTKPRLLQCND